MADAFDLALPLAINGGSQCNRISVKINEKWELCGQTLQSIQFAKASAAALGSCLNRQFKLSRPNFHLFAIPKV